MAQRRSTFVLGHNGKLRGQSQRQDCILHIEGGGAVFGVVFRDFWGGGNQWGYFLVLGQGRNRVSLQEVEEEQSHIPCSCLNYFMETCSIVHSSEAPQAEALSEHQVKSTPTPCCGHEVRPLSYSPRLLKGHKLNYRATRDCERHLF